jgi:hypothetical protein
MPGDFAGTVTRLPERRMVLARRKTALPFLTLAALSVSAIGIVWLTRPEPPLNRTLEAAMMPAINSYLDDKFSLPGWEGLPPQYKSKIFCDVNVIEIRPSRNRWRVGMTLNCGEFARYKGHLVEGSSGYPGIADFAVLFRTHKEYKVLSLTVGPFWADAAWVTKNFSSAAAALILGTNPPIAPDPIPKAWKAFGFPSGTQPIDAPS